MGGWAHRKHVERWTAATVLRLSMAALQRPEVEQHRHDPSFDGFNNVAWAPGIAVARAREGGCLLRQRSRTAWKLVSATAMSPVRGSMATASHGQSCGAKNEIESAREGGREGGEEIGGEGDGEEEGEGEGEGVERGGHKKIFC